MTLLLFVLAFFLLPVSLYFGFKFLIYVKNLNQTKMKLKSKSMSVNSLQRKLKKLFKQFVSSPTPETIKNQILDLLDSYKHEKSNQFIDMISCYKKYIRDIILERDNIKKELSILSNKIKSDGRNDTILKSIYLLKNSIKSLDESEKIVSNKLEFIEQHVSIFNTNFLAKKSQILMMLSRLTLENSISDIDIELNQLLKDFDDKVIEAEVTESVNKKIFGTEGISSIELPEVSESDLNSLYDELQKTV